MGTVIGDAPPVAVGMAISPIPMLAAISRPLSAHAGGAVIGKDPGGL
ncbi:hypothetical protein [Nocardia jejuensis]|nr:hypothetical protein [Nocardia jejuensis]